MAIYDQTIDATFTKLINEFCHINYCNYVIYTDDFVYDSNYCDINCGKLICRCKQIINPVAYPPYLLYDELFLKMSDNERSIAHQALKEILVAEDFIFDVQAGYYGDELDGVFLSTAAKTKFLNHEKIQLLTPFL